MLLSCFRALPCAPHREGYPWQGRWMFPCHCLGGLGSFRGTSPASWCHVREGEQLKLISLKFFLIDSQLQNSYFFSFPFLTLLALWQLDLVIVEVFSNLYDSMIAWLQKALAKTVLQISDVLWKVTLLPCVVTAVHPPSADSIISTSVWQRQLWKGLSAQTGNYWTPCPMASLLFY